MDRLSFLCTLKSNGLRTCFATEKAKLGMYCHQKGVPLGYLLLQQSRTQTQAHVCVFRTLNYAPLKQCNHRTLGASVHSILTTTPLSRQVMRPSRLNYSSVDIVIQGGVGLCPRVWLQSIPMNCCCCLYLVCSINKKAYVRKLSFFKNRLGLLSSRLNLILYRGKSL